MISSKVNAASERWGERTEREGNVGNRMVMAVKRLSAEIVERGAVGC